MKQYELDITAERILRTAAIWEKCTESDIIKKYVKLPEELSDDLETIDTKVSYSVLLSECKKHMVKLGYDVNITDQQIIHIALRAYDAFFREGY